MSIVDESEFQHIFKIQFGDKPSEETFCGLTGSSLPQRDDQPFCPRCTLWVVDLMGAGVSHAINANRNTAKAVAIEREAAAVMLDDLGVADMWADIATRYHLAAQAIRNGEHLKEEA